MVPTAPVSYTHLDVYKRQALAFEQPPDGDFLVEQGGQQPFQYGKVRFIPKEVFHRPVETEDVYKRQVLRNWDMMT